MREQSKKAKMERFMDGATSVKQRRKSEFFLARQKRKAFDKILKM